MRPSDSLIKHLPGNDEIMHVASSLCILYPRLSHLLVLVRDLINAAVFGALVRKLLAVRPHSILVVLHLPRVLARRSRNSRSRVVPAICICTLHHQLTFPSIIHNQGFTCCWTFAP